MSIMKHNFLYLFFGLIFYSSVYGQTDFCNGFEAGWNRTISGAGFYEISPPCPVQGLDKNNNESNYSHGFRTGVQRATKYIEYRNSSKSSYGQSYQAATPKGVIKFPNFAEMQYRMNQSGGGGNSWENSDWLWVLFWIFIGFPLGFMLILTLFFG